MSKKFYEASVWSSAMRSRRNAKAIIDSNSWEYFITFTFNREVGRDYYKVKEICLKWKRDMEKLGGKIFLVIEDGNLGGAYHAHILAKDIPKSEFAPGAVYARIIKVKTHGKIKQLKNAGDYGIGFHAVQEIASVDDINRIADYMVKSFLEARSLFQNAIMANVWPDRAERLYFATRGLERGRRSRWFSHGMILRLYDNRKQKAALIVPLCFEKAITDIIKVHKIEHYTSGKFHTTVSRIVADIHDLVGALYIVNANLLTV